MPSFDHASKKSDSSAKPSGLTNSFAEQPTRTPAPILPTPQPASDPNSLVQMDRDENGNPAWWSRLTFEPQRYGVNEPPEQHNQDADRPEQRAKQSDTASPTTQPPLSIPPIQRQERDLTPLPAQFLAWQRRSPNVARSPLPSQPQPATDSNVQTQRDPVPYSRPAWWDRLTFEPQRPSIVQPKLKVGAPNDQYEQEADAVATQVMAMPEPVQQPPVQRQPAIAEEEEPEAVQAKPLVNTITPLVQRETAPEAEEEEVQTKPSESGSIQREALAEAEDVAQTKPLATILQREAMPEEEEVQTKPLATGILQREAMPEEEDVQTKALDNSTVQRDAVPEAEEEALQTKPSENAVVQHEAMPEDEEALQPKLLGASILQREAMPEEEEVQTKPLVTGILQREAMPEEEDVQAKSLSNTSIQREAQHEDESIQTKQSPTPYTPHPTPSLETQLSNTQGSGSPLPDDVRSFMEPRFGADLSQVRVHTGASAVQMNKDLNAQAFTHKQDIFFGAGKSPGTNDLTAHELTHVVQQTGSKKLNRDAHLNLKQGRHDRQKPESAKDLDRLPSKNSKVASNKAAGSWSKRDSHALVESLASTKPPVAKLGDHPHHGHHAGKGEQPHPKPHKELTGAASSASKLNASNAGPKVKPGVAVNTATNHPKSQAEASSPKQATATNLVPKGTPESVASSPKAAAIAGGSVASAAPAMQVDTAPAVDSMGSGGGESAEAEAGQQDDKALEATAAATEGVELEGGDRAAATASIAEVADAGGGAAEGGGGGGGGGAAITDKPAPPVPDVSQAEPAQALAAIGQLPPAQLQAGLGGVGAAVGNTVSKERTELAANPPQMERPSGSPMTKEGAGGAAAPVDKSPKSVAKAPVGQAHPVPQPQPLPPLPPPPIQAVPQPSGDPQAIKASLDRLPTHDPGLNVTAGAPPPLELKGDADPNHAQEQKAQLEQGVTDAHTQGQQDLAQPMGENEIYPNVPKETLKAEAIGGGGSAAAGRGGAGSGTKGAEGDEAISIIAQQEHGAEIQSAVAQAQSQISGHQQAHTTQVAQEKEKSNKDITKFQSENEAQQTQERSKAQSEVSQHKEAWNKEQTDLVNKSHKDSDSEVAKGMKVVQQEQTQAEAKAAEHIDKGTQDAETAGKQGEEQATTEKQKGEQSSSGIFGWLADKAKAFFDGIKQAIQKAFELARAAVKLAIETAKKLATAVIEAARTAIVAAIKAVGEALIALGDVLLAAFPGLRDRFRNAIKAVVKAAEAVVNALANTLKQGILAALTLLGKGLDAALGLLEKGMLAAVDIAKAAVQGAISAAKAAVDVLGAFAVLAKDIAANPGQWIGNLGAGVMDGIRNHLWGAFQAAVKDWFNQKVEEVLGLGSTVWNLLKKGGMGMAEIGKMAWEAIKAAIPPALIQILIEQLVALIVPAAGLVLKIIEGIQAGWGTVSRILQAMDRFMAFLKVVKSGQSGPQFGQLLAAAGIILIDFAANWLLKKVRGAASKVAGKIKEIAKKIGAGLKGALAKLKKGAKSLKDRFLGKRGEKGSKGKDGKYDKSKDKEAEKQKRVDKAVRTAASAVNSSFAGRQAEKWLIQPILQGIKLTYGLKSLEAIRQGEQWAIHGELNPTSTQITNAKYLSTKEYASKLKQQNDNNKNRVVIENPNLRIAVDLEGKKHYEKTTGKYVETPHVVRYEKVVNPSDPTKFSWKKSPVTEATVEDLRLVKRFLKKKKQGFI